MLKFKYPLAAILCLFLVDPATATQSGLLLSAKQHDTLCTRKVDGKRYVDRGQLALAILTQANIPHRFLTGKTGAHSLSERAIKIVTGKVAFPKTDEGRKARLRLDQSMGSFAIFLNDLGPRNENYQVRAPIGIEQATLIPDDFFGTEKRSPTVDIVCISVSEPEEGEGDTGWLEQRLRIRGTQRDLRLTGDAAKTAKPATLAITDNIDTGKTTAEINALVGLAFSKTQSDKIFTAIPFVEYHREKTTKKDEAASKVETLGLGVMLNALNDFETVAVETTLTPQFVFDRAQNTQFIKLSSSISPSFAFGPDIIVGSYNILANGNVWLKPDISFLAEAGRVTKAGNSPVLALNDTFSGVGGQASLHFYLPNIPMARSFLFGASYRYMELFSLPISHAAKWTLSTEYSFDENKNYSVSATYENGRNEVSYQDEEAWKLALGVRY